ncbi:MAG: hypothetical protein KTR25_12455 [Myxococcales bacterium]|nr:hypothetical protein [Myxococcales bacterium]
MQRPKPTAALHWDTDHLETAGRHKEHRMAAAKLILKNVAPAVPVAVIRGVASTEPNWIDTHDPRRSPVALQDPAEVANMVVTMRERGTTV